jgi:predicted AlkP superfamily pyrophosphatase or phosphodiesterase
MKCLQLFICTILLLTTGILNAKSAETTDGDRYVAIISIDGFPAGALWDERVPIPAIRELARNGAWSSALIPSTPSVTWPNHHSLVTGVHPDKHGVLTNGIFVRSGPGEPVWRDNDVDRDQLSDYPTIYDLAYQAGLRTAEVNWPVTRSTDTFHDTFPDAVDPVTHTNPQLRSEMIELGLIVDESEAAFNLGGVARDYVRTQVATHLIRSRTPNLLLFHLLNVDSSHHQHGKQSDPGNTSLAYADANVRMIVNAYDEAGVLDQTTFFIVSDHGFMNINRRIQPNVLLRQNGLLKTDESGIIGSARVQVLSNGGTAMVFATNSQTKEQDIAQARSLFEGLEGIDRILGPSRYSDYGLPDPDENQNMGDLVLNAADGYSFTNGAGGDEVILKLDQTAGTHGYLNDIEKMRTIFIASGNGIRPGTELDVVDNRSVAPTAAHLLGLELDTADGERLRSILNR